MEDTPIYGQHRQLGKCNCKVVGDTIDVDPFEEDAQVLQWVRGKKYVSSKIPIDRSIDVYSI